MEWIILLTILSLAYFIYSILQKRNDIEQRKLGLRQKQFEQKERELDLNPIYKRQKNKKEWNSLIQAQERQVENNEMQLKEAQELGDKKLIKEAKDLLIYSRDWLKISKSARKSSLTKST